MSQEEGCLKPEVTGGDRRHSQGAAGLPSSGSGGGGSSSHDQESPLGHPQPLPKPCEKAGREKETEMTRSSKK